MADRVRLTPTPAGQNGRDPTTGKFLRGNPGSKGNPLNGRANKIRCVLLAALTDEQAKKIADRLIRMATAGDMAAIRELFDRTIGKSPAFEILERLEKLEAMMEERSHGN